MQSLIVSGGTKTDRTQKLQQVLVDLNLNPDKWVIGIVDGKKNISIDQVRETLKFLSVKPGRLQHKVVLVEDAQAMSVDAQNSFLKTLEEPPEYAQIILECNHPKNLLDTIVSRCRVINLSAQVGVDISSDGFIQTANEFLDLIECDIGKKIDWVTDNKDKLKDRNYTLDILSIWELILRDLMIASEGATDIYSTELKSKIENLSKDLQPISIAKSLEFLKVIKRGIVQNNANTTLAVETFLINVLDSSYS